MTDSALVREIGNGRPLFVHSTFPLIYLMAGLPEGTHSAFCAEDLNMSRELRYWELHPDKIPAVIYFPTYIGTNYILMDENVVQYELTELQKHFDAEVIKGEAGYILKVNNYLA